MVRDTGFEPVTPSVSRKCSTTELTAQPTELKARLKGLYVRGKRFWTATVMKGISNHYGWAFGSSLAFKRRLASATQATNSGVRSRWRSKR